MGNFPSEYRTVYKSVSLNNYINDYIDEHSKSVGQPPNIIWNANKNNIEDLRKYEILNEDIIKQIIKNVRNYPLFNIYGMSSMEKLKQWLYDGTFDEIIKLITKTKSRCYVKIIIKNPSIDEISDISKKYESCIVDLQINDLSLSLEPKTFLT